MTTKSKDFKGTTDSGFKFTIREADLNNFELLEILSDVDENPLQLPKLLNMLLGAEQKKALYDHVRLKDGTVPIDIITNEIMSIFQSHKETKN